jgi:flagellum-specific peptidoglycan hydrolase FlgJ
MRTINYLCIVFLSAFVLTAGKVNKQLKIEEVNMLTGFGLETAKAVSLMYDRQIPVSVIMAQAILESGWGGSRAARVYNSLFGWKASRDWRGKRGKNGDGACRVYDSWTESYIDHARSLHKYDRYDVCFEIKGKTKKQISNEWARCLQKQGYCPSKDYSKKLISIINKYKLYEND